MSVYTCGWCVYTDVLIYISTFIFLFLEFSLLTFKSVGTTALSGQYLNRF